uniref:Uncharacterized protein n=1 Tax=Mycena chlorophos TaxID=658473 RepID=A0ABQ0KV74_MYCCL|nr:predicted protein [Mycena chlorophos]
MDRVSRRLHTRYPYTAPRLIPSRRSGNYLGSLRLRDFPGQYAPAPTAGRCDLPALRQIAHGGLDGLGLHAQIRDDGFPASLSLFHSKVISCMYWPSTSHPSRPKPAKPSTLTSAPTNPVQHTDLALPARARRRTRPIISRRLDLRRPVSAHCPKTDSGTHRLVMLHPHEHVAEQEIRRAELDKIQAPTPKANTD